MGAMMGKIMGPLMTAGGLIAAPFTGGSTLPIALSGFQQMMGPGGVLAPGNMTPSITPPKAPTQVASTDTPLFPQSAASGLTSSVPGAGAPATTGAGPQSDILTAAIQQAMGGGGGSPFATFA